MRERVHSRVTPIYSKEAHLASPLPLSPNRLKPNAHNLFATSLPVSPINLWHHADTDSQNKKVVAHLLLFEFVLLLLLFAQALLLLRLFCPRFVRCCLLCFEAVLRVQASGFGVLGSNIYTRTRTQETHANVRKRRANTVRAGLSPLPPGLPLPLPLPPFPP